VAKEIKVKWWLSNSASTLRDQINKKYPNRDKRSDGTIGDAAHAARKSDHNPDPTSTPPGVVRAIDIDADLDKNNKRAAAQLAEALRLAAARGDKRIYYIIYAGRITSGTYRLTRWKWRPYNGADPHVSHIHVSFKASGDHDGRPFNI
jgi:hypothetical protein